MLLYILITLLILTVLVLIHEFGHFIAAKMFGVKVEEFSIGLGPALYQKQGKETIYSVRLLPLGGYCSLQGETVEEQTEPVTLLDGSTAEIAVESSNPIDLERSFINKSAWQRFVILIAGVMMNFILALFILFIALLLSGRNPLEAFVGSFRMFFQIINLIFESIRMLFVGEAGINDLAGPVGVVQIVQEYYSYGLIYLLLFSAMLSINLGILNLLPIPALDGGQILILLIEKLKKGSINERIKGAMFMISYILLICLGIFVAFNDINRFMN